MSEPQSKLSPLPWAYRPIEYDGWGYIRGSNGQLAAVAREGEHCGPRKIDEFRVAKKDPCETNGRLIVRACNSHDALVAALEDLLIVAQNARCEGETCEAEEPEDLCALCHEIGCVGMKIRAARAALALAKGEKP